MHNHYRHYREGATEHQYEGIIFTTVVVFLLMLPLVGAEQALLMTTLIGVVLPFVFPDLHWSRMIGGLAVLSGSGWLVPTISPVLIIVVLLVGAAFTAHAAFLDWYGRYRTWQEYAGYGLGVVILIMGWYAVSQQHVVSGITAVLVAAVAPHLVEEWRKDACWLRAHCTKYYVWSAAQHMRDVFVHYAYALREQCCIRHLVGLVQRKRVRI